MKLKITVHGVAYEVEVEVLDPGEAAPVGAPLPARRPHAPAGPNGPSPPPKPAMQPASTPGAATKKAVVSPIAGIVLEVHCAPGDSVRENQPLLILEAMKMKTSITAPAGGKVRTVRVAAGETVRENQLLVELE